MDAEFMDRYFRKRDWSALFGKRLYSESQARQHIEVSLSERELLDDIQSAGRTADQMIGMLSKMLAGRATIVNGPNGKPELINVLPPEEDDGSLRPFTGDAAFAIPTTNYPIFANTSLGLATAEPKDAELLLVPARIFTSTQQYNKLKEDVHRNIRVVFCDEAQRRNRMTFQEPVHYAGAESLPLVFAAGSCWYQRDWARRSPRHSFPESIRRGVLPDIGVRVFPSAKAVHFPAETQEAVDQSVREYFRKLAYFEQLSIPQPFEGNTLFVVHGKLTGMVTMRLREEFKKRKRSEAEAWSYTGNEQDREAFQSWFVSQRRGPNVLVSSPGIVKDTLDFPTIRHLIICTRVSADALYHLIGRLAHNKFRLHQDDRVLITLQQFANSNLRATPFHVLDHGEELPSESFQWVAGHALISHQSYRRDARKVKGKERKLSATLVPMPVRRTKNSTSPIRAEDGTLLVPSRKSRQDNFFVAQQPDEECSYDPAIGPPNRTVVRSWARACDSNELFELYASIMLVAEEAHRNGGDPRVAVERKIAQLRERASRME